MAPKAQEEDPPVQVQESLRMICKYRFENGARRSGSYAMEQGRIVANGWWSRQSLPWGDANPDGVGPAVCLKEVFPVHRSCCF